MSEHTECILPFMHLYAQADGEMKPCCIAGGFDDPLNLKTMAIDDAFNSSQMKQLRKDMEEGKRNSVCDVCYKREDKTGHSPRTDVFNNHSDWIKPKVEEDYSVSSDFQHIDIRFSNLCNFKCRMCNHDFSSNWFADSKILNSDFASRKKKVLRVSDNIVQELIPHLSKIKSFYFAGGEPLIMPEHFKVLNYLYETLPVIKCYLTKERYRKARDLTIHYNTNLSVLKFEEKSLIDIWKGFKRIFLSISCDGVGEVGEYQRTGFLTDKFQKNLEIIKKHFKPQNVKNHSSDGMLYNFQYTTTIMNVYHIFDFIEYMFENNNITDSNQIDFCYAWSPNEYALNNISKDEKKKLIDFLNENVTKYSDKTKSEIQIMIDFIDFDETSIDNTDNISATADYVKTIETLQGGDFSKISPIKLKM